MKIKIFKTQNGIETLSLSQENQTFASDKGCINQPVDFRSLAELCHVNTWHDRCLSVKSKVIAGLGYDFLNDKIPQETLNLLKQPNKEYSFIEFTRRLQYDLELYGNAYIEVVYVGKSVAALYHLPARDVFVRKDRDGFWQMGSDGKSVFFENYNSTPNSQLPTPNSPRSLIHLKKYTVKSSYYGLPEWLGSVTAIGTHNQIAEFNLRYFANSAMPDLAIILEGGDLDEEAMDEMQAYLAQNIKGVVNAHKTIFIPVSQRDVKVRIEKLSDIKEGSFKLLKDLNRDEIISAHGVPPRLVSVVSSGSLGGGGEGLAQLATFMNVDVVPGQSFLESSLNNYFLEMFGIDPQIKFWEMEIMTYVEKINSYSIAVQSGILTVNEARKELGYAEIENNRDILSQLRSIRSMVDYDETRNS